LINSVLDFSKIEAGKMDLHSATFEVEKVFESAAEVVAQLAREKEITFHAYVDQTIPPVRGDGDRLRQILMNLLGNAVKFTERGRVVARVIPIERLADEIVLRFEVQDTGIGIAPDVVPTLFEPFAQAENSASRRFGGTGLGLSISKRLVELMGGEIGVQSDLGAGSLFWFTVRFRPATEPVAARKTLDGIAGLILSGDDTFAQIVERYMTSWSVKSRRAVSRSDVVEALQSNEGPTWVAIVDMDDIGVVDLEFTLANVQVLFPARVIAIGKGGLLHKPVRQSYLFDAITKLVDVRESVASRGAGAAAPEQARPGTGLVLVAEDDARLQRLLKLQFDELGTPVTFVSDGLAALEAMRRDHYSMVFMDCQMPNMDGLTATKAIREQERRTGEHIAIAAMTANAFAEDRDICIAAGMDDYLSKPVKLSDLRAMIVRWAKLDA
jgi:CheY-like chemotaxis protein